LEKIDILMTGSMMSLITDQLAERFRLHRLAEASDRDAFLAEIGPKIRGAATSGGHGPFGEALMKQLPKLEIVANFGVGYDSIDTRAAAARGILVTNTPDVLTEEVADLALGLLLATVRHLPQSDKYLREGKWLEKPYPLTPTLRGRTVGIVGLGRIGKAVARRIEAFGLPVHYHGRHRQADVAYTYHPTLVGLAEAVDVLMIVIPGGPETNGLVGADVLKALGPNGILINVARGTVVDEPALVRALADRTILSAGLDVFAQEPKVPAELMAMDHIVLLPHVGSATHVTRDAMGQLVVDNLASYFEGVGPKTPVAETPWAPSAA
jgi:lactate dehydrogenase-like 2-hydroxyacid dehydrogenase